MFWIAFWLIVIGYFVLGSTRIPTYFKMFRDDRWTEDKEAFWYAFFLMFIWPFYEAGKWIQNRVIHSLTREERQEEEYRKAQRIVDDWHYEKAAKERKEKEAWERALKEQ